MAKPLSPKEAEDRRLKSIPEFVIEAFNEVLTKNLSNGFSRVTQDEVMDLIVPKLPNDMTRQSIYDNKWLDVEPLFREAGWKVTFDKPGYNENYNAFWEFKAAREY